jgi:hypothetical protein
MHVKIHKSTFTGLLFIFLSTTAVAGQPAGMWPSQRHILTPHQRMQEQQAVQQRMAQQMPARFRAGYERMLQQQAAVQQRMQSQRKQP